jgi:hypothetical protein
MDIFRLETEQGIQHSKLVLVHLQKNDKISPMLHISLKHLQLQAGVSWPILIKPGHLQCKYVDPCYLTNTWEFLESINSHIHLELDTWIRPQCEGDSFIMEVLTNLPGLKPIELVHAQ